MSRLEEKSIKLLKQRFPHHKITDKWDLELQQFTAEDMIEFALYVAKASLEKASENGKVEHRRNGKSQKSQVIGNRYETFSIDKESIINPSNIVLL